MILATAGFVALALGMERHRGQLLRRTPLRREAIAWRFAAAILLVGALGCAIARSGAAAGTVLWIGMLSPGALLVVALLAWRARGGRG
ncbi:MAG: DUF3325 domain-containing protein [Comamonadaceae bacterium]|nr:MAG: DUF3325 domain-containing protein [Comamonadaceae bacterium]